MVGVWRRAGAARPTETAELNVGGGEEARARSARPYGAEWQLHEVAGMISVVRRANRPSVGGEFDDGGNGLSIYRGIASGVVVAPGGGND